MGPGQQLGTEISPEGPRTGLRAHEDGLGDVVEHLEQELRVGARLGRALDLVRVELAGEVARLEDAVDGREDGRGEEVGADGAHVEVHQGGGQACLPEEGRGLLLALDLEPVQTGEEVGLALVEPEHKKQQCSIIRTMKEI